MATNLVFIVTDPTADIAKAFRRKSGSVVTEAKRRAYYTPPGQARRIKSLKARVKKLKTFTKEGEHRIGLVTEARFYKEPMP